MYNEESFSVPFLGLRVWASNDEIHIYKGNDLLIQVDFDGVRHWDLVAPNGDTMLRGSDHFVLTDNGLELA